MGRMIDTDVLKEWVENWFIKNRFYHPFAKNNNIPITELYDIIEQMPTIEPRHGLLIPDATLPRKGCYHCMFREGNLCEFLPASVPVVECAKRFERHKDCPLVGV